MAAALLIFQGPSAITIMGKKWRSDCIFAPLYWCKDVMTPLPTMCTYTVELLSHGVISLGERDLMSLGWQSPYRKVTPTSNLLPIRERHSQEETLCSNLSHKMFLMIKMRKLI